MWLHALKNIMISSNNYYVKFNRIYFSKANGKEKAGSKKMRNVLYKKKSIYDIKTGNSQR